MDVFAALADPVRRSLLEEMASGPARVVDLASTRPISRPAISKHLRALGEAGLVTAKDHGRERHYALTPAGLAPVSALVERLLLARTPVSAHALDALATEVRRTSRDRRTDRSASSTPRQETA